MMADLSEYILREVRDLGRRVGHLETLETPISPYTPAAQAAIAIKTHMTGDIVPPSFVLSYNNFLMCPAL